MRVKRSIALILGLAMALTLLPTVALAANTYTVSDYTSTTGTSGVLYEMGNGIVSVPLQVVGSEGILKVQVSNSTASIITSISYNKDSNNGYAVLTGTAPQYLFLELGVNPNARVGEHEVVLDVYESTGAIVSITIKIYKTTPSSSSVSTPTTTDPTTPSYPEGLNAILMLAPLGMDGMQVPAPSGNYGDKITLRIPIFNRGGMGAYAKRILVTPVLSATLDSFPFDIEAVDYTRGLEEMRPGDTKEVQYVLRISKEATSGVKEVKFNAVYFNSLRDAYETATFSVFVTVVKGKSEPLKGSEGEEITTTPKIIIEGYSIKPSKPEDGESLYAGEIFDLTMKIRNTASENVQNIQVTMSNEAGVILPANNGSNTIYIDRIGAGELVERTVQMQTVPETEAKSHKLSLKFNYESAKTLKSYEVPADISLSVKQRIRMRIDDPVLEPEVMLGNALYVYFNIYNMGNSTVRNLMVTVEGEGLRMEESYYGGNMSSGGQSTADFGIIAETAGEIDGKIIITYEDAMGEVYKEEKPFKVTVTDMSQGTGDMMIDPETGMMIDPVTGMPIDPGGEGMESMGPGGPSTGMPLWLIIVIAVVVAGGAVLLILLLRKRRRRKLIEE